MPFCFSLFLDVLIADSLVEALKVIARLLASLTGLAASYYAYTSSLLGAL